MAQYRIQINLASTTGLPRDVVVNTFYVDTDADIILGTGTGGLAKDAAAVWETTLGAYLSPTVGVITAKVYAMSDPEPREPRDTQSATKGARATDPGAPEQALCLSYFADRNLPRKRGRLYIGPFGKVYAGDERPSSSVIARLAALAGAISGLGGINMQWVQHSPTTGAYSTVTDWWVDNEWDHVRSRGLKGTTRTAGTVSG
jgi:hypothetical protein